MILVKPEALIPDKLEFPRFNYEALGRKYQYFYALGNDFLHPNRVSNHFCSQIYDEIINFVLLVQGSQGGHWLSRCDCVERAKSICVWAYFCRQSMWAFRIIVSFQKSWHLKTLFKMFLESSNLGIILKK